MMQRSFLHDFIYDKQNEPFVETNLENCLNYYFLRLQTATCYFKLLSAVQCSSPDSRILGVANGRQLLGEERVHLGVDGDQLAQRLSSSQPHGPAGVLQGLQEGGLQLWQEGLEGNAHLEDEEEKEESWCAPRQATAKQEVVRGGARQQTLASSKVRVSSRAVFTVQVKRSPRMRMSGPVMLTTEGRSASGEVSLMTPPRALAASSFCSGLPVRTPSLRTGRIHVTPWGGRGRKKPWGDCNSSRTGKTEIQTSTVACKTQTQWDDMEKSPSRFKIDPFIRTQTHSASTVNMEFNEMKCTILSSLPVLVT